jgi:hypothetical protein
MKKTLTDVQEVKVQDHAFRERCVSVSGQRQWLNKDKLGA